MGFVYLISLCSGDLLEISVKVQIYFTGYDYRCMGVIEIKCRQGWVKKITWGGGE